jgi:predicted membrane-bound mannosyltransferase
MTWPALRPLTAATAAVVVGAVGAVPVTAAGAHPAPPVAAHPHAPPHPVAVIPPKATPAAVNATTTRDSGAPQTGLATGSVVVAGNGIEGTPPGEHGTAERAAGAPARARAPPR